MVTGRYRLVESIGQGGMGRVWRAADEILDRPVAVKEMRIDGLDAEDNRTRRERTLREARATARIDHPNVVRVYDVVDEGERLWIVMELVAGRSLERILAEDGPLSPCETARIGLGLVAALRQVHARGVLHRDIKPGNVLVENAAGTAGPGGPGRRGGTVSGQAPGGGSYERRVVLTDFGIAAIQDAKALTMVGMLVGSPDYMAPERISGRPQGPPSDNWSLGATLCAALGGRSPFSRDTTLATLHAVLYEEPELPAASGPLRDILTALLEKEPSTRPTLEDLETALEAVAFPVPTPTVSVGWGAAGAAGLAETLGGGGLEQGLQERGGEPEQGAVDPGRDRVPERVPERGEPGPDLDTESEPASEKNQQPAPEPALEPAPEPAPRTSAPEPAPRTSAPTATPPPLTTPTPHQPPTPAPAQAAPQDPRQPAPAPAPTPVLDATPLQPHNHHPTAEATTAPTREAAAQAQPHAAPRPDSRATTIPRPGPVSLTRAQAATECRPHPMPPGELPGPAVPAVSRPRAGHRRRMLAAAAATVATAGVVVGIILATSSGTPDDDTRAGSSASAPPTTTSAPSPTSTVEGTSRPQSLPPGTRREAGGFAWATPEGWRRDVKTGAEVHYTSPDGTQELVGKSALARGDLLKTWQTSERNAHQGQDYSKVRLEETTFRGHPAVIWEYTFTLEGVRWHARLLGFNVGGKSYQINTWYQSGIEEEALSTYEKVKDSFTVL
ncbi:protein kinase [Streptomyces koelreuteriae]|uniref:non-specific serine/threonine protein kinase n=2 Tax=Streptomyces TaxID=1883 RepID=A0ABX8FWW2_9ACTN|nr:MULTISPECIES: protein kinase [Streptomyces]QWB25589.1 protein kinase [Streptomyces koelreuteriae]